MKINSERSAISLVNMDLPGAAAGASTFDLHLILGLILAAFVVTSTHGAITLKRPATGPFPNLRGCFFRPRFTSVCW